MKVESIYKSLIFKSVSEIVEFHIIQSDSLYYCITNISYSLFSLAPENEYKKFFSTESADKYLEKIKLRYEKEAGYVSFGWPEKVDGAIGPIAIIQMKKKLLQNGHYCVTKISEPQRFKLLSIGCKRVFGTSLITRIDKRAFEAELKIPEQVNAYLDRMNECTDFYRHRHIGVWFAMDSESNILFFIINRPKKNLIQHFRGF
jgi:hypothetical protein